MTTEAMQKGGNILNKPTITDLTNATHDHGSVAKGGRTLNIPILVEPVIADYTNATHDHTDNTSGGAILPRPMLIKLIDDASGVEVANNVFVLPIPLEFNGMKLYQVELMVSTISTLYKPTYQLRNLTDSVDMLSTAVSVDVGSYTSYTAAIRSVVNPANAIVSTGDRIAINKTVAGTGELGDTIIISFRQV